MIIPIEQFRGDHYSCDGCDHYYETKNIRGMSHTCPKCKGTSVTNLSFEERKEEYKKYLLHKKEEARLIKKQEIADKKEERKRRTSIKYNYSEKVSETLFRELSEDFKIIRTKFRKIVNNVLNLRK